MRLNQTLYRIKSSLEIPEDVWASFLGLTAEELKRHRQADRQLDIPHLLRLCDALQISLNHLLKGDVDFKILVQRYRGDLLTVPEKYAIPEQHRSRARSMRVVTHYLENFYGPRFKEMILRRIGIHSALLLDLDARVSSQISFDLIRELRDEGLRLEQFATMGTMTSSLGRDTQMGQILSRAPSAKHLYESAFDELGEHLDQLCWYRLLSLGEDSCELEITPREDASEAFRAERVGILENCAFRQGVARSLLGFIQDRLPVIHESECMYRGDKRCVYHLSWGAI